MSSTFTDRLRYNPNYSGLDTAVHERRMAPSTHRRRGYRNALWLCAYRIAAGIEGKHRTPVTGGLAQECRIARSDLDVVANVRYYISTNTYTLAPSPVALVPAEARVFDELAASLRVRFEEAGTVPWLEGLPEPEIDVPTGPSRLSITGTSLDELLPAVRQAHGRESSWLYQICSKPVRVSTEFQAAASAEAFLETNLKSMPDIVTDLDLLVEVNESNVAIVAFYPSGTIRSVPARLSVHNRRLHVVITEPRVLIDPNGDQPPVNIPRFQAEVTLFAVDCK